jgi:hypothetical protein
LKYLGETGAKEHYEIVIVVNVDFCFLNKKKGFLRKREREKKRERARERERGVIALLLVLASLPFLLFFSLNTDGVCVITLRLRAQRILRITFCLADVFTVFSPEFPGRSLNCVIQKTTQQQWCQRKTTQEQGCHSADA